MFSITLYYKTSGTHSWSNVSALNPIKGKVKSPLWLFRWQIILLRCVSNTRKPSSISKTATHAVTGSRTCKKHKDTKHWPCHQVKRCLRPSCCGISGGLVIICKEKNWRKLQAELWWRVACKYLLPRHNWCSNCLSNFGRTIPNIFHTTCHPSLSTPSGRFPVNIVIKSKKKNYYFFKSISQSN